MNKENHLVEYKRELSETFERSVIAFLNSTGGHIYIGVNDDGSVYGVKDIDHVQRQVADRILNNIKPNAIGLFEVVTEEKDNKNIVHVAISGGPEKPYYLKKNGYDARRLLCACGKFSPWNERKNNSGDVRLSCKDFSCQDSSSAARPDI